MDYPRAVSLTSGVAMVVTDLHGDGEAYATIKQTFLELYNAGKVNYLIFCGDIIHGYGSVDTDYSLSMVLDIMKMRQELGDDKVIMLMGNHEMPHVYNVTLSKGNMEFTARFEHALTESGRRDEVFDFLCSLPFYVFTQAGVTITHAGASHVVSNEEEAHDILTYDHKAILALAEDRLRNSYNTEKLRQDENYLRQAQHFLAITGADDPRLHHLLRGQIISQTIPDFKFLWDTLFTRNEQGSSLQAYEYIVQFFLRAVSHFAPVDQKVIVAGHIGVRGGHAFVGQQQLRLASFTHANPVEEGEYLLLNCATPVEAAVELLPKLDYVFPYEDE